MTDDELRALVRDAVAAPHRRARVVCRARCAPRRASSSATSPPGAITRATRMYLTVVNVGDACVIEPT